MISTRITVIALSALTSAMLALAPSACFARQDEAQQVHWAYSAFFGSGYYKFGSAPGVTVVRANPRRTITEPSLEDGRRKAGFTLRLPVTLGHQGELASAQDIVSASLDTISFVPGVDVIVPIGEQWTIKPFANVGYGRASGGADSAWIYRAGISSRYTFDAKRFQWSLVNELMLIGFSGANSASQQSMPLTLALESRIPLRSRQIGDDPVYLHWHVARTQYLGKLEVLQDFGDPFLELDGEWEFGAAFGKGDERLRLWKFSWDRVGIALLVGNDGDLAGFRLNFRSLFER